MMRHSSYDTQSSHFGYEYISGDEEFRPAERLKKVTGMFCLAIWDVMTHFAAKTFWPPCSDSRRGISPPGWTGPGGLISEWEERKVDYQLRAIPPVPV
jgi:hypothetical protein